MKYTTLGASGLPVSRLILGAARFGEIDDRLADRVVGTALDHGITAFDTADVYAGGRSEEVLGRALRHRREQVVISTKVGLLVGDSEAGHSAAVHLRSVSAEGAPAPPPGGSPTDQGLSRKHLFSAIRGSLRRLGTDYVDIYQTHRWDPTVPLEETMASLDDLVRAGQVRYLGCSGLEPWQLVQAMWVSDALGRSSFISIQAPYNLVNRGIENGLLPACRSVRVGVLGFQVLAGGMLTGRFDRSVEPEDSSRLGSRKVFRDRYWRPDVIGVVERLREASAMTGRTPSQLSLGWVLANESVTSVIIGASNEVQISEAVAVVERPLDDHELDLVERATDPKPGS